MFSNIKLSLHIDESVVSVSFIIVIFSQWTDWVLFNVCSSISYSGVICAKHIFCFRRWERSINSSSIILITKSENQFTFSYWGCKRWQYLITFLLHYYYIRIKVKSKQKFKKFFLGNLVKIFLKVKILLTFKFLRKVI